MKKLKVNDEIIVVAGKDKGKLGKITKLNWKSKRALVKDVNLVKKAVKPTQENPNGGFGEIEAPIHMSNIALVSPKTKKATRVRIEDKDGKKERVAVACGSVL